MFRSYFKTSNVVSFREKRKGGRALPSWKSRGLRGSSLEELINLTNETYREKRLALIQKVPTPITPIKIDKSTRHITLAYFDHKSTVDYIGVVQGIPVCFDAKECASDTFALANVHEHQVQFMKEYEQQGGISFLLIYFKKQDCYYYLPYARLQFFWERAKQGGRKSFCFKELDLDYVVKPSNGVFVHYLEVLQKDLLRDTREL